MKIRINGKEEVVEVKTCLAGLIRDKKLSPEKIVIEHNHRIAPKEEWAGIILGENDTVEIVSFVGGG